MNKKIINLIDIFGKEDFLTRITNDKKYKFQLILPSSKGESL